MLSTNMICGSICTLIILRFTCLLNTPKTRIEACVSDIDRWMSQDLLKVNRGKTEVLILKMHNTAHHHLLPQLPLVVQRLIHKDCSKYRCGI